MLWKSLWSPVTKRHVERTILQTHPQHLWHIIRDVDSYSQFLPLCTHSKVTKVHSPHCFDADLTVGLPPLFEETYTSRVTVDPDRGTIETVSIASRSFDALSSRWQLSSDVGVETTNGDRTNESATATATAPQQQHQQPPRCHVAFEVELTVSDPLIRATLDQVLEQIAGRQVQAFAQRCRQMPRSHTTESSLNDDGTRSSMPQTPQ